MAFNSPPDFVRTNSPFRPAVAAQQPSGALALAGLCAIASGVLGWASWLTDDRPQSAFDGVAIVIAAAGATVGGLLAVSRRSVGAAIGLGGALFFSNNAVALIGQQFDFGQALDPTSSKLLLASGVAGLGAIGPALITLGSRTTSTIGVVIAAVAFVPAVATGALVHLDDSQDVSQLGLVGGYLLVAIVVRVAALRGRGGVIAAMVVSVAHLPLWIETAKDIDDRQAAGWAGLVALGSIAVLGGVAARALDPAEPTDSSSTPSPGYAPSWAARPTSASTQFGGAWAGRQHLEAGFGPLSHGKSGDLQNRLSASSSAVSGQWRADPYGRFQSRYWNGAQWTEHVSSNGVNAIDPI